MHPLLYPLKEIQLLSKIQQMHTQLPPYATSHTCMYIHTYTHTHTHTHTQTHLHHHAHAGWILSSVWCEPEGAWQGCGDAPSGWGYSRPAEQGGKLFMSLVVYHAMYSIQCTTFKDYKAYPTNDQYWYAWEKNSFVHWKHVHLVVCGQVSPKIGQRMFRTMVWNQNSSELHFSY